MPTLNQGRFGCIKLPGLIRLTVQNETGRQIFHLSNSFSKITSQSSHSGFQIQNFLKYFAFANDNHALLLTNHQLFAQQPIQYQWPSLLMAN